MKIPIHEAKAQLSKLIARACAGEPVVILHGKRPVVRLVPIANTTGRQFGAMRGRARIDEAFFEPLAADDLDAWQT